MIDKEDQVICKELITLYHTFLIVEKVRDGCDGYDSHFHLPLFWIKIHLKVSLSKDDPFEMFSNVKFQTQSKRKHLLKYMLKLKQKTQL